MRFETPLGHGSPKKTVEVDRWVSILMEVLFGLGLSGTCSSDDPAAPIVARNS